MFYIISIFHFWIDYINDSKFKNLYVYEILNYHLLQYGERYPWSAEEQGMVLGSYFWGYLLTSLPGGILADYFGGTRLVGFSVLLSAVLTAFCPAAAGLHYGVLIADRFILGFLAVFILLTLKIYNSFSKCCTNRVNISPSIN